MSINNTDSVKREEQFLRLVEADLSSKKTIGAMALNKANQELRGNITDTAPKFIQAIYDDLKFTPAGVVPAGTFTVWTPADLVVVEDTKHALIWDILEYVDLVLSVEAITWVDTLSCLLVEGAIDVEIPADAVIKVSGNAVIEWNNVTWGRKMRKDIEQWNYTQIITGQASMSWTLAKTKGLAGKDLLKAMQSEAVKDFENSLKGAIMSKIRNKRTTVDAQGNNVIRRIAWGIPYFTRNTFDENGAYVGVRTDNKIAVNGVAGLSHVNQVFVKAIDNGWVLNTIAGKSGLVASLAGLEKDKIQVINDKWTSVAVVGGGLQKLVSPIAVDWNVIDYIELTDELTPWDILMYNRNDVSYEQMGGRFTESYTTPDQNKDDNHRLFYRDEATIVVRNASNSFYYLTGCTDS